MMPETIFIVLTLGIVGIFVFSFLVRKWDWMPLVLLVVLWYIPRQTVPNGLLENLLILRWLTVFLIPLIMIVQFFKMMMRSIQPRFSLILIPLVCYIFFCFFSGIINSVRPVELIGSMVLYIRYPLLFIALINMDIQEETIKKFLALFFFLLALQIPECLYRFLVLNIHGDFISFSLGPWGAFDLGIYAIYGSAIIVAYDAVNGVKWSHLVFLVFLLVLSLLGEIKSFIISIPIVALCTIYASLRQKGIRRYFLAIALPAFIILLILVVASFWTRVHSESGNTLVLYLEKISYIMGDPSSLIDSEKADVSSSRILGSAFVWNYLKHDWSLLFFGAGPGALLAGNFLEAPGRLLEEIPYRNQVAVTMGETGIIGLLLYYGMILCILVIIVQANKNAIGKNMRVLGAALFGIWIFYAIIGPFYDLVWRHDSPNFTLYFLLAFLYSHRRNKEVEDRQIMGDSVLNGRGQSLRGSRAVNGS